MNRAAIVITVIPCLVVLSGCSHEEIPTTHLSPVTVSAAGEVTHMAWDEPPKLIKIVKPKYPEVAREDGVEGRVILSIVVDKKGKVTKAEVILSEPSSVFNEVALEAVRQYEFEPAKKDGKPIKIMMGHSIIFTLVSRKPL